MKKVLLLCPTSRDRGELSSLCAARGFELACRDFPDLSRPDRAILGLLEECRAGDVAAVLGSAGFPGAALASIAAWESRMPGVPPEAVFLCLHRFHCREAQARLIPEATPEFRLVPAGAGAKPPFPFPFLLRPAVAWGRDAERLVSGAADWPGSQAAAALPPEVWAPFNALQRRYSRQAEGADSLVAEPPVSGLRAGASGWAWGGKTRVLAFHGPPEAAALRARVEPLARRLLQGIGFDNGTFRVEILCDPVRGEIRVMDVIPGGGPWEIALDLALGFEPAKRP